MTTLSKFFEEHIAQRKCQEILHSETCKKHLIRDILLYTLSSLKYFAPICLLPALIKIKKINKKKLRKYLEYYLSCSVMGTSVGFSINALMCLIRNIYGRFNYYSIVFIPSLLGSLPLYLGPYRVIDLFETTIFQCSIETFLLMRKNILSRTIANSLTLQTWLFMICSAVILHVKQNYNNKGFWLLKPNPKIHLMENVENNPNCSLHPKCSCQQYIFNGMRKYFVLGLSLDFIKMLMSHVDSVQNQWKFISKFKNFRIRSMALLTAYIGIYRFAHCWLSRKSFFPDFHNHLISSYLAGFCYYLYPQPTLFSFALVQAIRSFWKIFKVTNANSQNKIIKLMLKIPYAKLLFPFGLANLIHLMVMQPKYVSHLATTVANGLTNKYPTYIQNEINLLKRKYKMKCNS